MNCIDCNIKLRKICKKLKKYPEFYCKYNTLLPGTAKEFELNDLAEDFFMLKNFDMENTEMIEEEFEEFIDDLVDQKADNKIKEKKKKKRIYLVDD